MHENSLELMRLITNMSSNMKKYLGGRGVGRWGHCSLPLKVALVKIYGS
jgi:hypothetical protein